MTAKSLRVGLDIGGTFTDLALLDEEAGRLTRHKLLTTPEDPSVGALEGLAELLSLAGVQGRQLGRVIHGTTLVANTIIQRQGAVTALLATKGFSDVLEMGRENRYDIYDLNLRRTDPLVERTHRMDVPGRMDREGIELTELDLSVLHDLPPDVTAVAICFLHAFKNPAHELATRDFLMKHRPHVAVSISSEVAPEIREYERMTTTVANAYVQPHVTGYLERMETGLRSAGYEERLYLMLSEGGITSSEVVRRYPVRLVESGPAAGVLFAQMVGDKIGVNDLVAFDMGGTTAKACLVHGGGPRTTNALEVARAQRFKKGSGIPLRIPSIEVIEIGAGGGSIARIDDLGMLRVGPNSAGASPGPACYGRGGLAPTVTDASLALGYLGSNSFLGGRLKLDLDAARHAITGQIASPLGLSEDEAAHGIFRVVSESMASAIRVHLAEAGVDHRRLMLVATGGAGPLHAGQVSKSLGLAGFIAPTGAGVASAVGLLAAPISFDVFRSVIARLVEADLRQVDDVLATLAREAEAMLAEADAPRLDVSLDASIDMRYAGQFYEVNVPLVGWPTVKLSVDYLQDAFMQAYRAHYGHTHDVEIELLTCRVRGSARASAVHADEHHERTEGFAMRGGQRQMFFGDDGWTLGDVYRRADLGAGMAVSGPAVIEEDESTTLIHPGMTAEVDSSLNVVVRLGGKEATA